MAVFNPTDFVRAHLAAGTSEKDIRRVLEEQHSIHPEVSRRLIRDIKATDPEILASRQQVRTAVRRSEKKSWFWTVLIGVGICVLGIAITAIAYAMTESGGTFIVAGGAILLGLLTILKGVWHFIRWW